MNYGSWNFGVSDLNLDVGIHDKDRFNNIEIQHLLDKVSIVAFGGGTWNVCNSHSISEANESLDNNRVSVQVSFCLREGFKDVDKLDPALYTSDKFLDEGCELENNCLTILAEFLRVQGFEVKLV